jgi:hypothetical protein
MSQRLFHVEMKVIETKLWDLLDAIEKIEEVGDLEIRHVPKPARAKLPAVDTTPLALPDVQSAEDTVKGPNQIVVLRAMKPNAPVSPREISKPAGLSVKQTAMALYHLLQLGIVVRPKTGLYMRVAP